MSGDAHESRADFTVACFRSTHLSLAAKGLLAVLITFPPNTPLPGGVLARCVGDDEDVADAAMKELADAGIVDVETIGAEA